ncbi:uncharacterized protein LOC113903261 [Bos indicus x Bos taurus]|uniref:uncharacterized protein LOC113903261 n=1 Tax=Bos indicus x Bos taurus TaxID=30522 RepID=UPI000F7D3D85|nr:uncharacterized protein LOC113903261 [Bos indicus x Bos taurus]
MVLGSLFRTLFPPVWKAPGVPRAPSFHQDWVRSKEKADDQNWAYGESQNVAHQRSGSLRTGASGAGSLTAKAQKIGQPPGCSRTANGGATEYPAQAGWRASEPAPRRPAIKEKSGSRKNRAAKWLIGFASISLMNIHEVRSLREPELCVQPVRLRVRLRECVCAVQVTHASSAACRTPARAWPGLAQRRSRRCHGNPWLVIWRVSPSSLFTSSPCR